MSLDRSLKAASRLGKKRNVLKRAERIKLMQRWEVWSDKLSPYGLPKIRTDKPLTQPPRPRED